MIGRLVELTEPFYGLQAGAEGIVWGSNAQGWLAVFGGASVTLPFADEGVAYQFV